jgi:hypothetical protein
VAPEGRPARRAWLRRRELNNLKGAMRCFDSVPWVEELALDNVEFDIAWRLTFGGMTPRMAQRIDHPSDGFAWRGAQMERGLAHAIKSAIPCPIRIGYQPEPERIPPDHELRLASLRLPPSADIRADVDVVPATGKRVVFDVRTANGLCASALSQHASAAMHLGSIERAKNDKYAAYYTNFKPFVVTLTGAVTDASHRALWVVAREAV